MKNTKADELIAQAKQWCAGSLAPDEARTLLEIGFDIAVASLPPGSMSPGFVAPVNPFRAKPVEPGT